VSLQRGRRRAGQGDEDSHTGEKEGGMEREDGAQVDYQGNVTLLTQVALTGLF
jgi:hypothetical protein